MAGEAFPFLLSLVWACRVLRLVDGLVNSLQDTLSKVAVVVPTLNKYNQTCTVFPDSCHLALSHKVPTVALVHQHMPQQWHKHKLPL
jgi:hypothetical protein